MSLVPVLSLSLGRSHVFARVTDGLPARTPEAF
jgi:hypothetical protein